ncbi:Crp/Fnr family transcriptional regulator [Chitinophaga sp.]|uniref:Crp/Fnr family transcriptional regulator n=1 Tax=Chitinophaga sp. TaxID=1869181 RepID=UPI0031CE0C52
MSDFNQMKAAVFSFQPLDDAEWAEFSQTLHLKTYKKGDFLIREGEVENQVYFLNTGATRHYFIRDGKEFTVDFQFAGDFVTAYYSLITREPSTVFVEVLEETTAVIINYQELQSLYAHSHHGERIGRLMAEYQYVKRLRREMDLLSRTAEERYAHLLQRAPMLVSNISVKHLSSYLGIQPESLSRIRKQLMGN